MGSPIQPVAATDATRVAPPPVPNVYAQVLKDIATLQAQGKGSPALFDRYVAEQTPFHSLAELKSAAGLHGAFDTGISAATLGYAPYIKGAAVGAVKNPVARRAALALLGVNPMLNGGAAMGVLAASPEGQDAAQSMQNVTDAFSGVHPAIATGEKLVAGAAPFALMPEAAVPKTLLGAIASNAAIGAGTGFIEAPRVGETRTLGDRAKAAGLDALLGAVVGGAVHGGARILPKARAGRAGLDAMDRSSYFTPEQLRASNNGELTGTPLQGQPALDAAHELMGGGRGPHPSYPVDWSPQLRELGRAAANNNTDIHARFGEQFGVMRNPEATAAKAALRRAGTQLDASLQGLPPFALQGNPALENTALEILRTAKKAPDVVGAPLRRAAQDALTARTPLAYSRLERTLRNVVDSRWNNPPADFSPEVHIDPLNNWQQAIRGELESNVPGYAQAMAHYSKLAQASENATRLVKASKGVFSGSQTHRLDQGLGAHQLVKGGLWSGIKHALLLHPMQGREAEALSRVFESQSPADLRAYFERLARPSLGGFRTSAALSGTGHNLFSGLLTDDEQR